MGHFAAAPSLQKSEDDSPQKLFRWSQHEASSGRRSYYGQGRDGQNSVERRNDICLKCSEKGHWVADCLSETHSTVRIDTSVGATSSAETKRDHEVYANVTFDGQEHQCLLDKGNDLPMIPRRLVPEASLHPNQQRVFTANKATIQILGLVRLFFKIGSVMNGASLLVSEHITEMMLSIDFLKKRCVSLRTRSYTHTHTHTSPFKWYRL